MEGWPWTLLLQDRFLSPGSFLSIGLQSLARLLQGKYLLPALRFHFSARSELLTRILC